ncbi:MAG: glutamate formimidoyltransferase [Enterobacteriaceae bacterium]
MAKLVECIPNFSEGRDQKVIGELIEVAKSVAGVTLLDHSSDASHNRSVFTLVGDPEGIAEVAFRLCKLASERIDLTKHTGEHPRMGATDVIPFVPIKDITTAECVEISKKVAQRIYNELKIPSFLYEDSASKESRRNLAAVRKGQFEGMAEKLQQEEWAPDFGERKVHPTAGITAIGARMPLVAYNVNLDTSDIEIANTIAKSIRASGGGFKYCKAIGVMLEDRNIAQVSMNMVNYEGTPLYRVFEVIKMEAARWGVNVIGSEVVGLTPAKALIDCAEYYLKIENFDYSTQVFENHLLG